MGEGPWIDGSFGWQTKATYARAKPNLFFQTGERFYNCIFIPNFEAVHDQQSAWGIFFLNKVFKKKARVPSNRLRKASYPHPFFPTVGTQMGALETFSKASLSLLDPFLPQQLG